MQCMILFIFFKYRWIERERTYKRTTSELITITNARGEREKQNIRNKNGVWIE